MFQDFTEVQSQTVVVKCYVHICTDLSTTTHKSEVAKKTIHIDLFTAYFFEPNKWKNLTEQLGSSFNVQNG